jgi:hypothetical protein
VCEHGHYKLVCKDCGIKCINCNMMTVRKKGAVCNTCLPAASRGSPYKEARVRAELEKWASDGEVPLYTSWNKAIQFTNPKACEQKRPDFAWDMGHRAVLLEVDEQQHIHYNRRCELVRVSIIAESYGGIPVHLIRYNPDAFKIHGKNRPTKSTERVALLKTELAKALATPDFDHRLTVQHLWYDQDDETFSSTKRFKTLEDYHAWVDAEAPFDG